MTNIIPECIAVIQAGGKGTRMRNLTGDRIPKPMLEINGKPMILWQMDNVSVCGIKDFVIITGHLGEAIEEYFGDGSQYGYHIDYIRETVPLGSAGSLYELKKYPAKRYFVIFGDVMFDMDIDRLMVFHIKNKASATLVAHPNSHPYDSDLLVVNDASCVQGILSKKEERKSYYHNCVNAGLYILEKEIIDDMKVNCTRDMERDVILPYIRKGKVYAYSTPEYVKDAGTPERYRNACDENTEGLWRSKNLRNKQKAIFLDRDGTVNVFKGLVKKTEEFELEGGVSEAIRIINTSGYLAIIITNQPVIARGDCTVEELQSIHNKLETLLGNEGAYVDAIYYCPHHPDAGYLGERPEYKIKCACRKPETGLVDKAIQRFNIDPSVSYMIGDTTRDVMTGIKAGMKTMLVQTGEAGKDGKYDVKPDYIMNNLLEAMQFITRGEEPK